MNNINKRLDDIFAIHVKLTHTNDEGFGKCYTCGTPLHYREMDCGHYPQIPREHTQFKWDVRLHKPQCVDCNRFKDGLPEPFRDRLLHELGTEKLSQIEFDSHKPFKMSNWDKELLYKKLRNECKEMLKEKMFNVNL